MDNHDPELRKMGEALEMANAKLAELTAERESLSQDRNHWAFEARLMAEKVKPLEDERDALKAKVELATKCLEGLAFGLDSFGGRINRLKMMEAARQSLDAILNDAREGGE